MLHSIFIKLSCFFALSALAIFTACNTSPKATLVLKNGKIVTVDNEFSIQQAVAVLNDRILAVDNNENINEYIDGNTRVIDLAGKVVLPGLIDAQGHMLQLGRELTYLDIDQTNSFEEIVSIVKNRVKETKPGEWIVGGRWDQNNWRVKEFPQHEKLSQISPHNPVFLLRVDGYAALVNKKAMEISGITAGTASPFGGTIIKDRNNIPTGVLINRAMNIVKYFIPEETDSDYKEKILKGIEDCLKNGLTSWHEIGIGPYQVSLLKELVDADKLKMRGVMFLGQQEDPVLEGDLEKYYIKQKVENYGNNFLSVKGIQLHFDGALGSRGAAFFEPYDDDPNNTGLLRIPPNYIYKVASTALKLKMIVNTSCIGTRANNICLNEYEKALHENPITDHRLRITHAQVLLLSDIPRFAQLGVIPSMQPIHATSDKNFVIQRIGVERVKGAYAWRSLINSGSIIACGSDFPVESNNPFWGMYAAVTRKDAEGNPKEGWFPEQCITLEEAIRGYTIWAAYSVFQDDILGSIVRGKLADFTIIDRDILSLPPEELLQTKVVYTIVDGKIEYSSP